jgi:hypothetical protein
MNIKLNPSEKNAISVVGYIINSLKIKVTTKTLKETLYLNPNFPSLLSLSDVMKDWGVNNLATRIHYEDLINIPLPAIAYINIYGGIFAPIRNVTETSIEWRDHRKKWKTETIEEFNSKWNNVVLLFEPKENAGEKNYTDKWKEGFLEKSRKPVIIAGLIISLLLISTIWDTSLNNLDWKHISLFAVKLGGTFVSSLLILNSMDSNNSFIRSICGNESKNDCNNILNSKAAKIWGGVGWSEIGFVYFFGGLLASIFTFFFSNSTILFFLIILNFTALPYTVFSIYYQYKIAKSWCRLCLIIQLLFWLEFMISSNFWIDLKLIFDIRSISVITFSFLQPILLLSLCIPYLKKSFEFYPLKKELQKSKFNPEYVESLFEKQPIMPPIFHGMKTVIMGDYEANNTITVVTNPLCGPCRKLHLEIESFLKHNKYGTCFQFIFSGHDDSMSIANTLLHFPVNQQEIAMNLWYSGKYKTVEELIEVVSHNMVIENSNEQTDFHRRWSEIAEVRATPTIYLNGREMPLLYSLNDVEELFRIFENTSLVL